MNAAMLLAPGELRAAFQAHKSFLGWAAIGVGLLADFMSVLGPVALFVFLFGLVTSLGCMMIGAVSSRLLAPCRAILIYGVVTSLLSGTVFAVETIKGTERGLLADIVPGIGEVQDKLFAKQLAAIETSLASTAVGVARIEDTTDRTLATMQSNHDELLKRTDELSDTMMQLAVVVAAKSGVPETALQAILIEFEAHNVPDSDILLVLEQKAAEWKELKAKIAALTAPTQAVKEAKARASMLLDAGDFAGARQILEQLRDQLRQQREFISREEAEILEQISFTYSLEFNYPKAAIALAEAAAIVQFDSWEHAQTLIMEGDMWLKAAAVGLDDRLVALAVMRFSVAGSVAAKARDTPTLVHALTFRSHALIELYKIDHNPERLNEAEIFAQRARGLLPPAEEFFASPTSGVGHAMGFADQVLAGVYVERFRLNDSPGDGELALQYYQRARSTYLHMGDWDAADYAKLNITTIQLEMARHTVGFAPGASGEYVPALTEVHANIKASGSDKDKADAAFNLGLALTDQARGQDSVQLALKATEQLEYALALLDPAATPLEYYRALALHAESLAIAAQLTNDLPAHRSAIESYRLAVGEIAKYANDYQYLDFQNNLGLALVAYGAATGERDEMAAGEEQIRAAGEALKSAGMMGDYSLSLYNLGVSQAKRANTFRDVEAAGLAVQTLEMANSQALPEQNVFHAQVAEALDDAREIQRALAN